MSEEATLDEFSEQGQDESESSDELRQDGFLTLPYDWRVSTLGEVAKEGGLVDGDWIESDDMDENGGIQLVQLGHIGQGQFKGEPDRFITEEFAKEEDCTVLSEGDLLISRMQEPILRSCLLPPFERDSVMAVDIARLVETDDWNRQFLKYVLNSRPIWKQGIAWASGTTRKRISRKNMEKLRLPTPSLSEQRKISTVLYTVDRAIEIANNISEQIGRVEQGLQQTLFAGKHLNCERKEAPTMEEVPEHWQVRTMGEVCDITMGSSPKSEHYNESGEGLPFFQANNEFGLRNPEHDRWCSNPVKTADKGDSLMTLRGTYVGQMNIADRRCCIGRGLAGISAGEDLLEEYLYQHLRRRERYVKSIAIGSTFDSVSSGELENLPIAIPPKEEQEQIANTLKSVQKRLTFTEKYTEQLQQLKRGLMQDLLSGKVRTTDTNIEVPEEIAQHG